MGQWNDWKSFLDQTSSHYFNAALTDDPESMQDNGILLGGVASFVLSNPAVALNFLQLIAAGKIDLARQQSVVRLLLDLHNRCAGQRGAWADVETKLMQTLGTLHSKIDDIFRDCEVPLELDMDELNELSGFGGGQGAIQQGLMVARTNALKAFISAFCDRYAKRPVGADLNADWSLQITSPKDAEYAEVYAGTYGGPAHAEITRVKGQDIWRLRFLDFPPWQRWYGLERAAYEAAAPIMALTLCAEVIAVCEYVD